MSRLTAFDDSIVMLHQQPNNSGTALTKYGGLIYSETEWRALRRQVDLFYRVTSPNVIEEHNAELESPDEPERSREAFVYLISNGSLSKIGYSIRPKDRMKTLQKKSEPKLSLCHAILVPDAPKTEGELHALFSGFRVKGEWFNLPQVHVEWFCQQSTNSLLPYLAERSHPLR